MTEEKTDDAEIFLLPFSLKAVLHNKIYMRARWWVHKEWGEYEWMRMLQGPLPSSCIFITSQPRG